MVIYVGLFSLDLYCGFGGNDVLVGVAFMGLECEIGDFDRWPCEATIFGLMVVEAVVIHG